MIEELPGFLALEVTGKRAVVFENEGGGHRWQRVPPTEKRGRVHTSTVTVAVLEAAPDTERLDPKDVEIRTQRGSGPGGQHRNMTDTCVVAVHRPSKISVTIDGRSQHQNMETALRVLALRLDAQQRASLAAATNAHRRQQLGSGMRGDKIRTYREMDNRVTDHRTGQRWALSRWRRGQW